MKKHPIIVIKLGTSSIVHEKTHQPLLSTLALIVETAVSLRKNGYKVVIVSSGAIGTALRQMGLSRRPKHLPQVQALAAIGQCRLMGLWDQLFERMGQTVAQILLTRGDIADRTQYINAQNTFSELLNMGVIPIVNENDTLSVAEIKFGDNDTLSAITAGMIQADYLFLMTDVDCLYDKNPRTNPDAKAIEVVENIADLEVDVSSAGSALGTGGMSTKIVAARLATAAGVTTVITRSSKPENIYTIVEYVESKKTARRISHADQVNSTSPSDSDSQTSTATQSPPPLHTRFLPLAQPIRDRHFWLLHGLAPHGTLYIDHGAALAIADHAGLLPVGIVDVDGAFAQQECVRLVEVSRRPKTNATTANLSSSTTGTRTPPPFDAHSSREVGRALVNYSATEIRRIAGLRSTEIAGVLGYADSEYVAFRENVAMIERASRPSTPTPSAAMGLLGLGSSGSSGPGTPTEGRLGLKGGLGGYVEG